MYHTTSRPEFCAHSFLPNAVRNIFSNSPPPPPKKQLWNQENALVKGLFTRYNYDCDFFISTIGLHEIWCTCSHGAIATMILNPIQHISCDKNFNHMRTMWTAFKNGHICFYLSGFFLDLVSLRLHFFVTFSARKVSIWDSTPHLKLGVRTKWHLASWKNLLVKTSHEPESNTFIRSGGTTTMSLSLSSWIGSTPI